MIPASAQVRSLAESALARHWLRHEVAVLRRINGAPDSSLRVAGGCRPSAAAHSVSWPAWLDSDPRG